MKRFARIAVYFAFGFVCMGIAWGLCDVHGLDVLKVGVGATAIIALFDYFL